MKWLLLIVLSSALAAATEIDCESALAVEKPIYRGVNGKHSVFLFPFVRTAVEFVDGEPYVTVYRGLRGKLKSTQASGRWTDRFPESEIEAVAAEMRFGDFLFTTLSPKTALEYLKDRSFTVDSPQSLTVLKMRLPLKRAYIAKRKKNAWGFADPGEKDEYVHALSNRNYIWFKWKAPARKKERELVWNLNELGGDLLDPRFQLELISVDVRPNPQGEYVFNFPNWNQGVEHVRELVRAGAWVSAARP